MCLVINSLTSGKKTNNRATSEPHTHVMSNENKFPFEKKKKMSSPKHHLLRRSSAHTLPPLRPGLLCVALERSQPARQRLKCIHPLLHMLVLAPAAHRTAAAADGFESDAAGSAPPPAAAVARSETEAAGSEPAACRAAPAAAPSSADLSGIPHALFTPGRHSHCFWSARPWSKVVHVTGNSAPRLFSCLCAPS